MSPWLSQRRVTFDDPVETISAILDRLYRAEQIIERLNAAPETQRKHVYRRCTPAGKKEIKENRC